MFIPLFSAIAFSIGTFIDEAQGSHYGNKYVSDRLCSRARSLLVFKWMIVGFFLTMSYKAVLRAMMMKIEYDKPIDTLDDMLKSEKKLLVSADTPLKAYMEGNPLQKVRELYEKEQIVYYNWGTGTQEWIDKG